MLYRGFLIHRWILERWGVLVVILAVWGCEQIRDDHHLAEPASLTCASEPSWRLVMISDAEILLEVDGVLYRTSSSDNIRAASLRAFFGQEAAPNEKPRLEISHVKRVPGGDDVQVVVGWGVETLIAHKVPVKPLNER
jgi:hypothetical protein